MSAVPTNIKPLPSRLDDLVLALIAAKKTEDEAKAERVELENRILALVPAKEEGSETTTAGNGFKVTTTGKLSYKADDLEAVREVTRSWDANLVPIKTTSALDETGCKYLRANRPELWMQLTRVVTVQPAKTAIKVGA